MVKCCSREVGQLSAKTFSIFLSGLMLMSGCASQSPRLDVGLQKELEQPLLCEGEVQCKEMWERAAFFVSSNSAYKIQIYNDNLIQTYSSTNSSTGLSYKITREPLGSGRYRIWVGAWCANIFGCHPNHLEASAKAKLYIRSGAR